MSETTSISWTDATWNPSVGCTRVSEGCDHCYAFALHDKRFAMNKKQGQIVGGLVEEGDRHIRGNEGWPTWAERVGAPPEGWAARARSLKARMPMPPQYDEPFSKVQLLPDRLDAPLHWRKPRRVFVNSMSDLFHEDVPDEFIDRVFAVMALTHQHTYQVLTKRPERMRAYLGQVHHGCAYTDVITRVATAADSIAPVDLRRRWPLPNVWLGVSVENQRWADERIPLLLQTLAAVRFISAEPLLGPIDLDPWFALSRLHYAKPVGAAGLAWIIVGGESGPKHRDLDLAWVQSIRDQCRAAGVSYFGKQNCGARPGIKLPGDLGDQEWPEADRLPGRTGVAL